MKRNLTNTDISMLSALSTFNSSPRRNISQPALSTPNSARESPCDQFGRFTSIHEESSDDDEGRRSVTPTPTNEGEGNPGTNASSGVKLRNKKKEDVMACDPFADLLSPKSASRLRWSQELNPLYDYIKGFKISDSVKLYDSTPSKLVQSTKAPLENSGNEEVGADEEGGVASNGKPPSMIIEEEGEDDELGSVCWEGDILSEFSQDTMSVTSQDTQQSPTSPTSSIGVDMYSDTLSLPSKVSVSKISVMDMGMKVLSLPQPTPIKF